MRAPDKRDRLIEELLAREEFVDYWAYQWSDLLLVNGTRLRPEAVKAFYTWIRERVKANTPWDEFARQIVLARGSSIENGATNFYALHQDPEAMTENVSQAFLGLSIGCAKCHNHPLEKWTNDQYYAMANLFARVRAKGWGGEPRNGDGVRTLFVASRGDLVQPSKGVPQPPAPLDGEPLPAIASTTAASTWPTGSRRPRIRTSRGRSRTACGRTSSASGWSSRSTTCGCRTRPATKSCWRRRRSISSISNYDLKALMRVDSAVGRVSDAAASRPKPAATTRGFTRITIRGG